MLDCLTALRIRRFFGSDVFVLSWIFRNLAGTLCAEGWLEICSTLDALFRISCELAGGALAAFSSIFCGRISILERPQSSPWQTLTASEIDSHRLRKQSLLEILASLAAMMWALECALITSALQILAALTFIAGSCL